jgi:hypothetical protein
MRALRIAPPVQLPLLVEDGHADPVEIWCGLPEPTRQAVLALLARLIVAGGSIEEEVTG